MSETQTTRVQQECDTNETRVQQEFDTNKKTAARMKIFSYHYISYIANEGL